MTQGAGGWESGGGAELGLRDPEDTTEGKEGSEQERDFSQTLAPSSQHPTPARAPSPVEPTGSGQGGCGSSSHPHPPLPGNAESRPSWAASDMTRHRGHP